MDRVVLRGGYGIFYQHDVRIGSESVLGENPPFFLDQSVSQSFPSTTPVFLLRNGFPTSQFGTSFVDLTKLQIRAQDPNQRTPYVQQASFGPQIQLSSSTVLDISYVGNFGRKENRLRNANQALITGYTATGTPLIRFPYANLNTNLTTVSGTNSRASSNWPQTMATRITTACWCLCGSVSTKVSGMESAIPGARTSLIIVDNLTGGSTPAYAYNYSLERSFSPFDTTHRLVGNVVWNLPIGKGGMILNDGGTSEPAHRRLADQ